MAVNNSSAEALELTNNLHQWDASAGPCCVQIDLRPKDARASCEGSACHVRLATTYLMVFCTGTVEYPSRCSLARYDSTDPPGHIDMPKTQPLSAFATTSHGSAQPGLHSASKFHRSMVP